MSKQCNKNKKAHIFDIGGNFDIAGTMQFADSLANIKKNRKANEELYNNAIDNTRIGFNGLSSINNLDDLESQLSNYNQLHEIGVDDLIGNDAYKLGNFLSTSSQLAKDNVSNSAIEFGVRSGIGQIVTAWMNKPNRKKAERAVDDINQRVRDTNELYTSTVNNRLNNIMQNQMSENQWNYIAALGGNLHSNSTTWSNGLNYIGSGGSHESNPNDGVAISTAPDGLQNKVEEGEVVWNDDYVFSKRLKVPKRDLEKNKWKGETYADVAKKLMDESAERPNDPITLRWLDDSLSRLRDSQEELKAKQESNKITKEIASMPPELLAQMQQQAQQPTEEEMMQQQAMGQVPQEQMPMVDPLMQQPTMEQPPMYAKGGHLFFGGGNGLGVNVDYSTGHSPINSYGSQRPFNVYGNSLRQTFNPTDVVSTDMAGKYGSVGQNIQANNNGFSNPTLQGETKTSGSGSGINKGALFSGIASGIDMIGAGFQSAGYKGGDLNALYKGTKHKDMFGDNMHKVMNGYLNIGLMPSMFAEGGHLFTPGGSVKAVSGKGFITPLPNPQIERIGSTRVPTLDEIDYINKKAEYVNVNDAQKYGGFYNNVNKINEYLNGSTPMDVKNVAQGVANQQSREAGEAFINRFPVKKNYGLGDNAYILNKDNQKSVDFFLKNNPNLNLDSDTIYFYNKDKNDAIDKNKSIKANKVKKEIYDKNSVENIKEMSGIDFNRTNMKAKGGHLHATDPYIITNNNINKEINPFSFFSDYELYDLYHDKYGKKLPKEEKDFILQEMHNRSRSGNVADIWEKDFRKKGVAFNGKDLNSKETTTASKNHPLKLNAFDWDETGLRYAPVWGSIFNLARSIANRPDYGNPERIERAAARIGAQVSPRYIGDYLRYRPLDEAYYLNQLNAQQNAANNAIVGLSNGNRSMALASMLANDYNYNNQRGNAYRQGLEYNEAQRQRAAEFNRGTNQFNAQQYMQAAAQNAHNRAQAANLIASAAQMREAIDNAYGASQSANWTNLFNNIGNVGRDEMNRKMTNDLYDYSWLNRSGDWGFNGQSRKSKRGGYLTIKTNNRRKE